MLRETDCFFCFSKRVTRLRPPGLQEIQSGEKTLVIFAQRRAVAPGKTNIAEKKVLEVEPKLCRCLSLQSKKGVIAHDALEKIFSVVTSTLKLEPGQDKMQWVKSYAPVLLDCIQFAQVLHKDNSFTSKMLGKGACCLEAISSHIVVKRPFEDYTTSGSSKFDVDVQLQTIWMKLQVFTEEEIRE